MKNLLTTWDSMCFCSCVTANSVARFDIRHTQKRMSAPYCTALHPSPYNSLGGSCTGVSVPAGFFCGRYVNRVWPAFFVCSAGLQGNLIHSQPNLTHRGAAMSCQSCLISTHTQAVSHILFSEFWHVHDDLLRQLQYLFDSTPDDHWFDGLAVMESLVRRVQEMDEVYWERASRGQGPGKE